MEKLSEPIGIFDSGVGGLTVARAILNLLPGESLLYFADTRNIPYGEHPPEEVEDFALRITSYLVQRGIKLLAIACNYSSALIYHKVKELYPNLPVVGVLQAGARLAGNSPYEIIGVLATRGTVKTRVYPLEIKKFNPLKKIFQTSCPFLVSLIEGFAPLGEIRSALKPCLKKLERKGIEALVLGCTHYPLVKDLIEEELGGKIALLDPAEEMAKEVEQILKVSNLVSQSSSHHSFIVSGNDASLKKFLPLLLGVNIIKIEHVEL